MAIAPQLIMNKFLYENGFRSESETESILSLAEKKNNNSSIRSVSIDEVSLIEESNEKANLFLYDPVDDHRCKCIIL